MLRINETENFVEITDDRHNQDTVNKVNALFTLMPTITSIIDATFTVVSNQGVTLKKYTNNKVIPVDHSFDFSEFDFNIYDNFLMAESPEEMSEWYDDLKAHLTMRLVLLKNPQIS